MKVTEADRKSIWPHEGLKVFLSHKSTIKKQAGSLKDDLKGFGISCFVAHKDIKPTRPWEKDIERALCSMDVLVALMSKNFHASEWTDQEVGYALGRGVPVVAVKIGANGRVPYGFMGKAQALSCSSDALPTELIKIFIRYGVVLDAYINAVGRCRSYDEGNGLAEVLPEIKRLTQVQAGNLVAAYNANGQIRGSYGFNGARPAFYGHGLAHELNRVTGKSYKTTGAKLVLKKK